MPEIQGLDTEALERMADTLGQPEAPAPIDVIPDWLKSSGGEEKPQAGEPVVPGELPEWLRPPVAPPAPEAPSENVPAPVMAETDEERLVRLGGEVEITEGEDGRPVFRVGDVIYTFFKSFEELEKELTTFDEGMKNGKLLEEYLTVGLNRERLEYALQRLKEMKAAKEAEAAKAEGGEAAEAPPETAPAPEETEGERLARERKDAAAEMWERSFKDLEEKSDEELLKGLIGSWEEKKAREIKVVVLDRYAGAVISVDDYLTRLRGILAKKEASAVAAKKIEGTVGGKPEPESPATVTAPPVEAPVVSPVLSVVPVEAPPLAPAAVSFAARVVVARERVAGALRKAELLPGEISEERQKVGLSMAELPTLLRRDEKVYEQQPDGSRRELASGVKLNELSSEELGAAVKTRRILEENGLSTESLDELIGIQQQYQQGREWAEANNKVYDAQLAAAAKELKPGWFEKEPAVVKEMAELQKFFDRTGNAEELRRTITEIEGEKKGRAWKNGGITAEYKRKEEAELTRAKADLATLESADKFMARTDMPKILRAVIDAARAGRRFEFGTGPVANFRRRVYESVVAGLGIEVAPVVEVLEAAVPVVAAAPVPEPAAVMPEPKPAAAPEKRVESPAEAVAEKMKRPLSTFAKDLVAAREKKDQRAFARAVGETQERLVRGFADNPQGLHDELVGLPQNEQKQLLAILLGAVKSGRGDPRLGRFTKELLEKKGLSAAEVSAGALGIFGTIIEWITGMTVKEFMTQMNSK